MSPDDKITIANFPTASWQAVVNRLNRDGLVTEYDADVRFFAKDFIRRNERSVKIHLRRQGYVGRHSPIYVEANIFNTNGFAFYDPDRFKADEVVARLNVLIEASF